jgi:hypothetical protein
MFELPVGKLPQRKRLQLHRSAHQPPIYIVVEGYEYDSTQKAVVYLIETGVMIGAKVWAKTQRFRYSALEEFNQKVLMKLGDRISLNPFPEKSTLKT